MKTHKVLALVATVAVALSGWCYDPPKHTNAYTRAGVTFAQRGGMEASTYVVTNVTMNGNARMLPQYLYELDLDDTYPEDAAWYYAQADYSDGGGCSVRRIGNAVERNYDWKFDAAPTFVVRTKGSDDRFPSVAVCNVGTNLTEEIVRSGTPSRFYKCLAGHATDGVNENGVFAEINVVDGNPQTSGWRNMYDIHPLGAVRWAIDNGKTAEDVATNLALRITFPQGWEQNFHYLIADETATYIVENGVAHPVTNAPAVMTNFKLYPKTQGAGWERYELLSDTANAITDAWFTRAYAEDTDWISEFDSAAEMETAKEYWRNGSKESHRGQHVGNKWWWQSVHTSVYDLKARTLKIAVQEIADWYVFGLPASGSGKVKSVNGKVGEVTLHAEDVGAVPTVITNEVRVQLAEKLDILPNGSTNGLRLAVGGSGMVANVDGNVSFKVAGERSLADYGITNKTAELPSKWALANVTNKNGQAVKASDVRAISLDEPSRTDEEDLLIYLDGGASMLWFMGGEYPEIWLKRMRGSTQKEIRFNTDYLTYTRGANTKYLPWDEIISRDEVEHEILPDYNWNATNPVSSKAINKYFRDNNYLTKEVADELYLTNGAEVATTKLSSADGKSWQDWQGGVYGEVVTSYWEYFGDTPSIAMTQSVENVWCGYSNNGVGLFVLTYTPEGSVWKLIARRAGRDMPMGEEVAPADAQTLDISLGFVRHTNATTEKVAQVAYSNDLANLVPRTFTINGTAMTGDGITIQGMTQNALVLTNGSVKTYAGAAVAPSAIGALSEAQTKSLVDGYVSSTNQTFCDAVLAVGLNIDTNSVAVLNEIAATFGGFPIAGTSTTVGGLLAALAAAVAMLNKRSMKYDAEKDRYYTER